MHMRGLKLGLYANIGRHTCAGYPGSHDHFQIDAETFASWGVDMIKFDGCHANISEYETGKYSAAVIYEFLPHTSQFMQVSGRKDLFVKPFPTPAQPSALPPSLTPQEVVEFGVKFYIDRRSKAEYRANVCMEIYLEVVGGIPSGAPAVSLAPLPSKSRPPKLIVQNCG